jgi:site-specific DNA recombinase
MLPKPKTLALPSLPAIGYVRVSSEKQENSLAAQQEKIAAACVMKGWSTLPPLIDDNEFSGDLERPGARKMIELVKARKVSAVVISKLDRLTRSTRDVIYLVELFNKHKVALVSIEESLDTKSIMGQFIIKLFASLAELERLTIGQRTRDGLRNLKNRGLPVGNAGYGFTRQATSNKNVALNLKLPLLVNDAELKILERVQALHLEGASQPEIVRALNTEGYRTRKGTPWRQQYVHRILRRLKTDDD